MLGQANQAFTKSSHQLFLGLPDIPRALYHFIHYSFIVCFSSWIQCMIQSCRFQELKWPLSQSLPWRTRRLVHLHMCAEGGIELWNYGIVELWDWIMCTDFYLQYFKYIVMIVEKFISKVCLCSQFTPSQAMGGTVYCACSRNWLQTWKHLISAVLTQKVSCHLYCMYFCTSFADGSAFWARTAESFHWCQTTPFFILSNSVALITKCQVFMLLTPLYGSPAISWGPRRTFMDRDLPRSSTRRFTTSSSVRLKIRWVLFRSVDFRQLCGDTCLPHCRLKLFECWTCGRRIMSFLQTSYNLYFL